MKEEPQFPGLKRRGYSIAETAYVLNTTDQTVRNMIKEGKLKTYRLAGRKRGGIRVTAKSIEALIGDIAA